MRKTLFAWLITAIIFLTTTFAGMAFFGMGAGMAMEHGTCSGADCHSMPEDTSGMACVDHCLSTVPTVSPISVSLFAALFVVLAVFLLSRLITHIELFDRPIRRWHADIGKLLLHQNLSTIVLRN